MPSKKKKYNARFPAGRIKKIMQTDEEVGKVAQAVPVIISRTLELFVESLLTKSLQITQARNAKTLTPSHMKQCILSESRFDFLKDLVKMIPDPSAQEDSEYNGNESAQGSTRPPVSESQTSSFVGDLNSPKRTEQPAANFYTQQGTSAERTPVIQYGPKVMHPDVPKLNFSVDSLVVKPEQAAPVVPTSSPLSASNLVPSHPTSVPSHLVPPSNCKPFPYEIPPLLPLAHNSIYGQSSGDNNLYIDEDYDN